MTTLLPAASHAETWSTRRVLTAAVLVFSGCVVGATIGSLLRMPVTDSAIVFPPYAVLTAALLLTPTRMWWVLILAAIAGDFGPPLIRGRPVSFVVLAEIANTSRALVAAGGLRRLAVTVPPRTLNDAALFLAFIVLLGPAAGALLGAINVVLHDPDTPFLPMARTWFRSNALTGVSLVPLILLVAREGVEWLRPATRARLIEASALAAALVGGGLVVFVGFGEQLSPYLYLALALVTWASVRFGYRGAIGALSIVSAFAIGGVAAGRGPFVPQTSEGGVIQLQLFLLSMYAPVLLLASVVEQLTETLIEVRRGQARYRSVVEDQTELICRFLPDGTYTFANAAYCRYFERSPEELIGKSFWMFIPEASQATSRAHLGSFTPERPVATFEHEVIAPNGEVRWQQWTDRALFDCHGQVMEFQSVGRDVTDRRRAEERHRLFESQRRVEETLRETDRRKDEFLAMLAHELRNPLAPLSLAVEAMRGERLSDEAAAARDMIGRQVVLMTRLVDDLLDISRITHGKIELSRQSIDLVWVVLRAVEATRPNVEARGHELLMTLPGLPVHSWADSARLVQIVSNLVDNAAKYTPRGGRIEVTLDRHGTDVVLTVRDNGNGIAVEQLSKIFDPFVQLGTVRGGTQGGLGIGLTLVKRLVELHDGTIDVRTQGVGSGTEFVVTLPVVVPPLLASDPPAPPPRQRSALRILVVDDNLDAAAALSRLLCSWGHTVRVAHDGVQALEVHASFASQVAFLDLGLPGLNGVEVGRRIRASARGTRPLIVALTGFGQPSDRAQTAAAGFDHHFTKPLEVAALQQLLQTWDTEPGVTAVHATREVETPAAAIA